MSPVPTYKIQEFEMDMQRQSLQPGTYTLKLVDVTQGDGPSGYPYLRWTAIVCDEGPMHNQSLQIILSTSPQARWKMDEFLDAINAPLTGKRKVTEFLGSYLTADVEMSEDNEGRPRPQVVNLRPVKTHPIQSSAAVSQSSETSSTELTTPEKPQELRGGGVSGRQARLPF